MQLAVFVVLGVLVFCASLVVDYAHAHYAYARDDGRAHAAARWAVLQLAAGSVGFVVAVKVSLFALPCEAAGLYCGTVFATTKRRKLQVRKSSLE